MKDIEIEIEKLRFNPGDTLVATVPTDTSQNVMITMRARFKEILPLGSNVIIVLDKKVKIDKHKKRSK